jgi:hypothetical protein
VLFCALLIALFTHCQVDTPTAREERYVTVHLNDSLKRFDSVEIVILIANDTSKIVGAMWSGALPKPSDVPSFKLEDGDSRPLAIRVRGFDSNGALAMNMLITKEGGKQTVASLPVPKVPGSDPVDPSKPKPSVRLAFLQVAPGSLTPTFDSARTEYRATLAWAESSIYVSAMPVSAGTDLTLDAPVAGTPTLAGKSWDAIPLKVGDNTFHLKVTSGSQSAVYVLIATRAPKPPDSVPAAEENGYKDWKYHRTVDIKVNQLGLAQMQVIRDFPLLIRLTKDNFDFTQAAAGGKDIRFSTADGKPIAYEISRWEPDVAGGQAEIWVAIDTLRTDDDSARVLLHHGNTAAVSGSDGAKVFDPDKGYSAVWHLEEQATGQPGEIKDATGRYHGMAGAGDGLHLTSRIAGAAGYGQEFKAGGILADLLGKNGQGFLTMPRNFDPGYSAWTFQFWVFRLGLKDGVIFDKGDTWVAGKQRFQILCMGGGTNQVAILREGAEYFTNVYLPNAATTMIAMTYNGARVEIFVDGLFREYKMFSQGGDPVGKATFGTSEADGSDEGFRGILDETWFSNKVRSPEWLRFAFETQKPNSLIVLVRPPK